MTETTPQTTLSAATRTAGKLIDALPSQFLVLAIIVTGILWFFDTAIERRDAKIQPIIAGCLNSVPADLVLKLLEQRQAERRP